MVYLAPVSVQASLIRFRNQVLSHRLVQAAIFVSILVASLLLFWLGQTLLDPEALLTNGYIGVFVVNLIACATVLFPIPGEAVNIAAGSALNPLMVALVATVGSTIGEMTSYIAGYFGTRLLLHGYHRRYEDAKLWMDRHGMVAIFVLALIPIVVFDLLGITAGSMGYPRRRFIAATFAGRFLRYLLEAYIGYSLLSLLPNG